MIAILTIVVSTIVGYVSLGRYFEAKYRSGYSEMVHRENLKKWEGQNKYYVRWYLEETREWRIVLRYFWPISLFFLRSAFHQEKERTALEAKIKEQRANGKGKSIRPYDW